jgi:hypothetical protein
VADLVMVLDGSGRILEYSGGRDFAGLLPAGEMMRERMLDVALPVISEQLPLDVMMARLRENPEAETRCEFVFQPDAKVRARVLEARMVLLSVEGAGEYGVVLRDVTAVAAGVRGAGGAMAWFEGLESGVERCGGADVRVWVGGAGGRGTVPFVPAGRCAVVQ